MTPGITLNDVMALERRRGMWIQGGDVYMCVATYLLGLSRAQQDLLRGLVEYVAVSRSGNVTQGWPQGVLMDGSFSEDEIRQLVCVTASPDLNGRAIEALFRALADYRSVRESGGMDVFLEEYARLEES